MFEELAGWLGVAPAGEEAEKAEPRGALRRAAAALLVEAATVDESFSAEEREAIDRVLARRFGLSAAAARKLRQEGERAADRSTQLFRFTQTVNERLSPEQRIELIEMLWEVVLADGVLDPLEDTLLRRIGGLVYVPDRERGAARQRVMKRLGLAEVSDSAP